MPNYRAAIVGATGVAGQQAVLALADHPWFRVTHLVASRSHASYQEALQDSQTGRSRWFQSQFIPASLAGLPVQSSTEFDAREVDVVFSCVESDVARELEPAYAKTTPVVSTASLFRYDQDVPLVLPMVNPEHLPLVARQRAERGWKGFVMPIPNCSSTGLAIALKPLQLAFGLQRVQMVSLQAVSGAGLSPGVRALEIVDNVVPYIAGEERKVAREVPKILGKLLENAIVPAGIEVSAICTRVPVLDGHTEAVFATFEKVANAEEVVAVLRKYRPAGDLDLPSLPEHILHVFDDPARPQPRFDRDLGDGMTTSVGHLEVLPAWPGAKFVLLSHNTKIGAAKGAVLLAELLAAKGYLD